MFNLIENRTARLVLVGLGLLVIVVSSIWLIRRNRQVEEIRPEIVLEESKMMVGPSPVPAMTDEDKAAIDAAFVKEGSQMTLLSDVSGGNSVGTAWRVMAGDVFYHKVEASALPALEKGFFYEGWLVGPDGFFSTGRMAVIEGAGNLYYRVDEDKSAFTGVVITLEPEDGNPGPDKHVLEGSF